ncbi:MAG TPA: CesT family type III secretion system chaperone [Ramlibacter sp.]|uniref:CesT family type III secretion system chaperone n=1 Tax=Ramlibacter sp. TaxID=1917967 RepID=UPI002BF49113|nr:CesT family type III secretion system chaperone [Ramlibacter sp.]HVZ43388.1 CesT family type III secretion system chaperone [Ramlibacter sp.]
MTSEQYQTLLRELAQLGGLTNPAGLLSHGRVKIGEYDALLAHEPRYDENLLQVRILLGGIPVRGGSSVVRALLEANYKGGYGGDCIFSLYPESDDVIVTMRVRLEPMMSARELWQEISDAARHGGKLWDEVLSAAGPSHGSFMPEFRGMAQRI